MYQFAVLLRALACILITNSHMESVYPNKIFANGGLLGDVLFFALSGFLLYAKEQPVFFKWYYKRLKRVYLSTWIVVLLFWHSGTYGHVSLSRFVQLFIWPTKYHFVSSILVLYVVYYFLVRFVNAGLEHKNKKLLLAGLCLGIVFFTAFYCLFDFSYYHIDNVYSPMIWPLYLFAMMIGMYFRMNIERFLNKGSVFAWFGILLAGTAYAGTKILFSRGKLPGTIQWLNQVTLLFLLFFIFRCFVGLESRIRLIPGVVFEPVRFLSERAFEIYLVQIPLIQLCNIGKKSFPTNLMIVLGVIFLCACVARLLVKIVLQAGSWFSVRVKKAEKIGWCAAQRALHHRNIKNTGNKRE